MKREAEDQRQERRAREEAELAAEEAAMEREQDAEARLRERLLQQLTHQWEQVREARRRAEPVIETGPSNFSRAQVPWAYDLAAAWAWRFIVIAVALLMVLWTLKFFVVVVFPLVIALFIACGAALGYGLVWLTGLTGVAAFLLVAVVTVGVMTGLLHLYGWRRPINHYEARLRDG